MTWEEFESARGMKRYTFGMPRQTAERAMNEWWYRQCPCSVRLCRAKTPGWVCIIVEADAERDSTAIYWLSWMMSYFPEAKVEIKDVRGTKK